MSVVRLDAQLRSRRDSGAKLLVTYLTGGLGPWQEMMRAAAAAGADAIEVGIPFSDPVMDGPVIQQANEISLAGGTTPTSVLDGLADLDAGVPLAVMTYANLVARAGWERFAHRCAEVGVTGAILPDLPLEEAGPWSGPAQAAGVANVLLVAPTTPDGRLERIAAASRGFLYAVGLLGITGERDSLAATATVIAARAKAVTDLPVLVGVGIGSPAQAAEVCGVADGVVIGSAVVRTMLETGDPDAVGELVASYRAALDAKPA